MNEIEMTTALRRRKHTWEEKKELCEQWKLSGKSTHQFCNEQGIAVGTFYGWCHKLWPQLPKTRTRHLSPVMINKKEETKKEETESVLLEILFPNSTELRFKLAHKNLVLFIQEFSHAAATIR